MKRYFFLIYCFIIIIAACRYLYSEKKLTVAVIEFYGQGLSKMETAGVTEFLRTGLVNTELLDVIDRRNMEAILEEQKFQMSGCTTQECAVKMGKLLNIQKVITGNIVEIDNEFYITANVIDVETGKINISERIKSSDKKQLSQKCDELTDIIANRLIDKKSHSELNSSYNISKISETFMEENPLNEKLIVGINAQYFSPQGLSGFDVVNLQGIRVGFLPAIPDFNPNGIITEGIIQYIENGFGIKFSLSYFSFARNYSYVTTIQLPANSTLYYGGFASQKDTLSTTIINIGPVFLTEFKAKKLYFEISPSLIIFPTSLTIERSGTFLGSSIKEQTHYSSTGLGFSLAGGLDFVVSRRCILGTEIKYNFGSTSFKVGPYYVGPYGDYIMESFSLNSLTISGGLKILF